MAIGNSDFSRDFLAGAQLANMAWQRQERMQELKAQQAMNQIRERELAAQAEMLTAHSELYRQQAKMAQDAKEQETADLLAAQDYYHQLTETTDTTPEQARAQVDSVLTYKNPALGLKVQKIRTEEARQKKYAADSAPVELGTVSPLTDKNQKVIGHGVRTGKSSMHVIESASGKSNSASKIDDQLLRDLEDELDTAMANGDEKAITRARDHIDFLKRKHRDPETDAEVKDLYNEKNAVFKELVLTTPNNPRYKMLKDKYDELDSRIKSRRKGEPAESAPSEGKQIGDFKVRIKSK